MSEGGQEKLIKVLMIEDDPAYFALIQEALGKEQSPTFELARAKLLKSGLERLEGGDIDVILLELFLSDGKGLDSFHELHKRFPTVPVIILTSLDNKKVTVDAILHGAQDYLIKGEFDRDTLIKSISYAIGRGQAQEQLLKHVEENERAKRELKEREDRFRSLVLNIPGIVYRYRQMPEGNWEIEFISPRIEEITGYSAKEFLGKDIDAYFRHILPQDRGALKEAFERLTTDGLPFRLDYRVRHRNKRFKWLHEESRGVNNKDGKIIYVDGVIFDITERTKEKEQLDYLAYHDPLTNLPNREIFVDRLAQAIAQAKRKDEKAGVLFLDLDHFKKINDTLGHAKGDQLIKAVATRLQKVIYETDTVTRIGGGSFIVLLPSIEKTEHVINVANKLLTALKAPFNIENQELFTSCSIGVSFFPEDGEESETLIKNADTALHLAKEEGRSRYQLYSAAMSSRAAERMALENSLRRALERDEFRLHYQPQIDLKTGKVIGVEALIRWYNPEIGLVPPLEFIPIAEETGLIHSIGEWVLKTACKQQKEWQEKGIRSVKMAVNLSARQFHYVNLVDLITEILKKVGLDPKTLDLELTESTVMQHLEETVETLQKLKRMGINLTIDDFGTGYSSFMWLKKFPIDTLKIDRSFVRDIPKDADDRAIATAIISMAHSLKLDVVAEGVETEEQLSFLQSQHCDKMQGFLFSKPLPAEQLLPLLNRSKE